MNFNPKVSIYLPTKNRSKLLKRAIKSIINQDYKNIELIIVDDCSSDDTFDVIKLLSNNFDIKLIKNKKSLGPCKSRNLAINLSTGEFITGLDDDDYFSKNNRISKFVEYTKSYMNKKIIFFDMSTALTSSSMQLRHSSKFVNSKQIREANYIGNQVFTSKYVFEKAGLFDPLMPAWQDWDLWIRFSKLGYDFKNIMLNSYTIDETHKFKRITNSKEFLIREAKNRLQSKISKPNFREKISHLITMLGYESVNPKPIELIYLLFSLRIRSFLENLIKFIKLRK